MLCLSKFDLEDKLMFYGFAQRGLDFYQIVTAFCNAVWKISLGLYQNKKEALARPHV